MFYLQNILCSNLLADTARRVPTKYSFCIAYFYGIAVKASLFNNFIIKEIRRMRNLPAIEQGNESVEKGFYCGEKRLCEESSFPKIHDLYLSNPAFFVET